MSIPNERRDLPLTHADTITEALRPLQSFLRSNFPKGRDAELRIDVGLPTLLLVTFDTETIKTTRPI